MDSIIRRLRNEPALIWGLLGTVAALIVTLVSGGGLTVAAIPLVVAAIAKQFTTGPVTAERLKSHSYDDGYMDGVAEEQTYQAERAADRAAASAIAAIGFAPAAGFTLQDRLGAAAQGTTPEALVARGQRDAIALDDLAEPIDFANESIISAFWAGKQKPRGRVPARYSPEEKDAFKAGQRSQDPGSTN